LRFFVDLHFSFSIERERERERKCASVDGAFKIMKKQQKNYDQNK